MTSTRPLFRDRADGIQFSCHRNGSRKRSVWTIEAALRARELPIRARKPPVRVLEPVVCALEPGICARELAVCALEPGICAREPAVCALEPAVCALEPVVCAREPVIRARESVACARESALDGMREPRFYRGVSFLCGGIGFYRTGSLSRSSDQVVYDPCAQDSECDVKWFFADSEKRIDAAGLRLKSLAEVRRVNRRKKGDGDGHSHSQCTAADLGK